MTFHRQVIQRLCRTVLLFACKGPYHPVIIKRRRSQRACCFYRKDQHVIDQMAYSEMQKTGRDQPPVLSVTDVRRVRSAHPEHSTCASRHSRKFRKEEHDCIDQKKYCCDRIRLKKIFTLAHKTSRHEKNRQRREARQRSLL